MDSQESLKKIQGAVAECKKAMEQDPMLQKEFEEHTSWAADLGRWNGHD